MYEAGLANPHDLSEFRGMARALIAAGAHPREIVWREGRQGGLFGAPDLAPGEPLAAPAAFLRLADHVICHRDPDRLALLYEGLWRILHGERHLLDVAADPTVHRLFRLQKSVGRDIHKMHAFLRFRRTDTEAGEHFVAWFEPMHFILERATPFFVDRFASMRWSILTPVGAAHWNGSGLLFGAPVDGRAAPGEDGFEDWWRAYYRATFNPSRANPHMMRAEMPRRYWRNLPEARLIAPLLSEAAARARAMVDAAPTSPRKRLGSPRAAEAIPPQDTDLEGLARSAADCRRCPLFADATQTVFGAGPPRARLMLVGEQPGDQEDLTGKAFVGPAGRLLDRALADAGIARSDVYVTNAVKHFKFEARGKRRLHKSPEHAEVEACRWWLERELGLVKPETVVALGATAARALLGRSIGVLAERGRLLPHPAGFDVLSTVHPSFLLRLPDEEGREREFSAFVRDLRSVAFAAAAEWTGRRIEPAEQESS